MIQIKNQTVHLLTVVLTILSTSVFYAKSVSAEGGEKGDAGQIIDCQSDGSKRFSNSGFYFKDYAIETQSSEDWVVFANDPIKHLELVIKQLSKMVPFIIRPHSIQSEFSKVASDEFLDMVKNNKWYNVEGDLIETEVTPEEKLACKGKTYQLVTYDSFYDDYYISRAADIKMLKDPVQISARNIHEYLRKLGFTDYTQIVLLNRYLHSKTFLNASGSAEDMQKYLVSEHYISGAQAAIFAYGRSFNDLWQKCTEKSTKINKIDCAKAWETFSLSAKKLNEQFEDQADQLRKAVKSVCLVSKDSIAAAKAQAVRVIDQVDDLTRGFEAFESRINIIAFDGINMSSESFNCIQGAADAPLDPNMVYRCKQANEIFYAVDNSTENSTAWYVIPYAKTLREYSVEAAQNRKTLEQYCQMY